MPYHSFHYNNLLSWKHEATLEGTMPTSDHSGHSELLCYLFFFFCFSILFDLLFTGTQGLAVTYCCHGEEENKLLSIAQKCSLSLSLLPCEFLLAFLYFLSD